MKYKRLNASYKDYFIRTPFVVLVICFGREFAVITVVAATTRKRIVCLQANFLLCKLLAFVECLPKVLISSLSRLLISQTVSLIHDLRKKHEEYPLTKGCFAVTSSKELHQKTMSRCLQNIPGHPSSSTSSYIMMT